MRCRHRLSSKTMRPNPVPGGPPAVWARRLRLPRRSAGGRPSACPGTPTVALAQRAGLPAPSMEAPAAPAEPASAPAQSDEEPFYVRRQSYGNTSDVHAGARRPISRSPSPRRHTRSADTEGSFDDATAGPGNALWTGEQGGWSGRSTSLKRAVQHRNRYYYPAPGRGRPSSGRSRSTASSSSPEPNSLSFTAFSATRPVPQGRGGNEIRPRQVEKPKWRTVYLSDSLGYVPGAVSVLPARGRKHHPADLPRRTHGHRRAPHQAAPRPCPTRRCG